MTAEQKEFIQLTMLAVQGITSTAYPALFAVRDEHSEEASEMVLRYALTNGITPLEALPHIEAYLTES